MLNMTDALSPIRDILPIIPEEVKSSNTEKLNAVLRDVVERLYLHLGYCYTELSRVDDGGANKDKKGVMIFYNLQGDFDHSFNVFIEESGNVSYAYIDIQNDAHISEENVDMRCFPNDVLAMKLHEFHSLPEA